MYRCCLDDVVVLDVLAFFWRRQRPLDAVARLRRLLTTPGSYHRGGGGGVPRSELSAGSCSKAYPSLVAVVLGFVVTRLAQVGPRRACSRRCSSCPVTEGCGGIGVTACLPLPAASQQSCVASWPRRYCGPLWPTPRSLLTSLFLSLFLLGVGRRSPTGLFPLRRWRPITLLSRCVVLAAFPRARRLVFHAIGSALFLAASQRYVHSAEAFCVRAAAPLLSDDLDSFATIRMQ